MKLCTAACLWLVSASLYAQVAEELLIPEALKNQRSVCSAPMDAGTKIITRLSGAGSDVSNEDPIVLCFGQQLFINHNNDSDLSGDPDPATEPGIGYAFYTGIPNATGPEINDLTLDPALLDIPPPPNGGVWVARGNRTGDATFVNTGNIQNTYFGGAAGRLWFAPITITDFDNLSFDDGSCVNVRLDEVFSVLYLNDISLVDFSTPMGSLSGMMTLAGGISEVDGTPYTVTLVKFDDPSVTGIVDAAVIHNGTTTFSVPEEGNYTLTVTDGQGCSKTFIVSVPAVDPVGLCHTTGDVPADGNICMPVIVGNVNDISGVSFTTTWDPTILDLTLISDIHPSLGSTASFNQDLAPQGKLTFLWFDLNADVISMNDGDTLFSLCFNGVGFPGETSVLGFSSDPAVISVSDLSNELPTQLKEGAVTITVPDAPRIYASACPDGMGNAQLSYVGYGGTDAYQFTLLNSANVVISTDMKLAGELISFPGLAPDDYVIEILDQNGISDVLTITVSSTLFSVDTLITDPTCPGSLDGKIVISGINGSTGPFTNVWMGDGASFFNIDSVTDLGPGDWSLIVNDANGCADTLLVTLEEDSLSLSFAETPPVCNGLTGSIEATASSAGGGDLTWTWTDENGVQIGNIVTSPSPVNLNNVGPGKYFLTVSNGSCSVTDSTELGVLKNLSLDVDVSTTESVSCNGDSNGRIEISASADLNQTGFQFRWSPNTSIGLVTFDSVNDRSFVQNLTAGSYSITVVDDEGCMIDTTFVIGEPDTLRFNLGITPPACPDGDNGRISAIFNVFGGTEYPPPRAPYDYHWYQLTDTSSISLGTRGSERTGLSAGRYALAVTDANGCQDSTTIELGSGPNIRIRLDQDLVCPGDSDGQLSVEGDLAGNAISWSTGSDMETISNLAAGLYQVSVTETIAPDSMCTSVDTFRILDPDFGVVVLSPMQFAPRSVCNEPDSGIIFNLRTNYSGPLNFTWHSLDDSITTIPFLSVDSSGLYPFTAFDRITGCTVYDSVIDVQFPERIAIALDTIGPSCNGETDGSIQIVATGRGGQFDFTWGAPVGGPVSDDTSSLVMGLTAGIYDVTVTETADSSCTVPLTLQLSEPEVLSLTVDTSQDIRCFGEKNGLIALTWLGGNQDMAPIIRWSGDTISNTLLATDLDAGTYDIVLTDHRGCADSVSVTIIEPGELFARIPAPTPPICNGFQTTVTVDTAFGGTGSDFTFTVNNQAPRQPLSSEIPIFAGEHLISIFDEQGCSVDTFIMVSEPDPLLVDLGEDQEVGLGDSIRLNPVIVALAPVDTYIWTPIDDLSCVNCANPIVRPFETRTYNLTVVDQDGCEGMDDIMISVNRARRVYIPNGFTPNGDGLNEKWQVHTSFGVNQVISTHLFDRWGNLVFEDGSDQAGPNGSRGWNGKFDGQLMNPGVYVYMVKVEFIDGIVFTYRGDVTMTY